MANAPLTATEIEQCKGWLGYPQVTIQANPIIGTSRVFEDVLQLYAGDQLIGWIRSYFIVNMNQLDLDLFNARARYQADELVGEGKLNKQEHARLLALRDWLVSQFEEKTGIQRYKGGRGGVGGGSKYEVF